MELKEGMIIECRRFTIQTKDKRKVRQNVKKIGGRLVSILVSAIIICLLTIIALYLSIKLDCVNGEKEYYKKENERLQEKNRDLCMKVAKYISKGR